MITLEASQIIFDFDLDPQVAPSWLHTPEDGVGPCTVPLLKDTCVAKALRCRLIELKHEALVFIIGGST